MTLEKDIVAQTADGCSMIIKFEKFLTSYHQTCIAHALQLAIVDLFYKKSNAIPEEPKEPIISFADVELSDDDDEVPLSELARKNSTNEYVGSDDDSDAVEVVESNNSSLDEREFAYHDLISKVKPVVKLFRKSPTKNDNILQKYVIADVNKEFALTSDSKTRRGSLANTLNFERA